MSLDTPPPAPAERRRRRAVDRLVLGLVGIVLLLRGARGIGRAFEESPRHALPPPLEVDLAKDGVQRLRLLPGIGPSRAASILEDRRSHGPVGCLRDLTRIHGIGPAIVQRVKEAREVRAVVTAANDLPATAKR